MGIYIPTTIGGTISASDSDTISSDLDVSGLPPGTRIWNVDVGSFFVLTDSTASLVTDEILAVKGITGARWIIEAAFGSVASVSGASVDNSDPDNPIVKAPNGWTKVTVAAPGTDFDITFNGETGYSIEIVGVCINNGAVPAGLTLEPNGLSTNTHYQEVGGANATPAADRSTTLVLGGMAGSGMGAFKAFMVTKKGTNRWYTCDYSYGPLTGNLDGHYTVGGFWADTTTDITKVTIHSTENLAIGSYFLWRLIPLGA